MLIPNFTKIPLVASVAILFKLQKDINKVSKDLKELYLNISGEKIQKAKSIDSLVKTINSYIQNEMESYINNEIKNNPFLTSYYDNDIHLDYTVSYDFFSPEKNKPIVGVHMEFHHVYIIYASFLKYLKKNRPEVFPLLKEIMNILHNMGGTTVPDIAERLDDFYIQDAEEDSEFTLNILDEIEKERQEYEYYVLYKKKPFKNNINKRIEKLYRKVAKNLSPEESLFVDTAIKLFKESQKQTQHLEFIESDIDYDSNSVIDFFNILWDQKGIITENRYNDIDYIFNNQMPPVIRMCIKDKQALEEAKEIIKFYILNTAIYNGGYCIWNSQI